MSCPTRVWTSDELAALRLASAAVQLDGAMGPGTPVGEPCASWAAPPSRGRSGSTRPARPGRAPGWPPCRAAKPWPPPSRRSPSGDGCGSGTRVKPGWWTPGGSPTAGASGTWRPGITVGARSARSASTGWRGPLVAEGRPDAFARPLAQERRPAAPVAARRRRRDRRRVARLPGAGRVGHRVPGRGRRDRSPPGRIGRLSDGCDQCAGLPILRAGLPRPRRDPRPARLRDDMVAWLRRLAGPGEPGG